jgi:hypothetical protein
VVEPTHSRRDAASVIFNPGPATPVVGTVDLALGGRSSASSLIEIITDWEVLRDNYTRLSGA